jgi:manganese oxidase
MKLTIISLYVFIILGFGTIINPVSAYLGGNFSGTTTFPDGSKLLPNGTWQENQTVNFHHGKNILNIIHNKITNRNITDIINEQIIREASTPPTTAPPITEQNKTVQQHIPNASDTIHFLKPLNTTTEDDTEASPPMTPPISITPSANTIEKVAAYDKQKGCTTDPARRPTMEGYLHFFNCGHVSVDDKGVTHRQFSMNVTEGMWTRIANGVNFPAWTFNHTLPGPTMRMTEGDNVTVTIYNDKENKHAHSLHMHSIHPGNMDGTMLNGPSGNIPPGGNFTYKFIAGPFGVFPYHCHMEPIALHINMGLYGMLIIDPKVPRPQMIEMAMLLNGYDLKFNDPYPRMIKPVEANGLMSDNESAVKAAEDSIPAEHDNSIYTVNGKANLYMDHPIPLKIHQDYRIYLVNMLDFEQNSFHLHGQLFEYYPAGTSRHAEFKTDIVDFTQGDRGIIELKFDLPGCYMFHGHIDQIASRGWSGAFNVPDEHGKNGCESNTIHVSEPTPPLVAKDE